MKASVLVKTYQQEAFVEQTIESVLAQRTEFPWELVVADDCSRDGTPARLRSVARRAGGRLRLIERPENLGPVGNFLDALGTCRGEYVALLDGDDYWTSADKLRRQVERLDADPRLSACSHDAEIVSEAGERLPGSYCGAGLPPLLTTSRLLRGNPLPACGLVFRRAALGELPAWFGELPFTDWALHILLSLAGPIAWSSERLAAYRRHGRGMWSGMSEEQRLSQSARSLGLIGPHLPGRWRRRAAARQARLELRLALVGTARGESSRAWRALGGAFRTAGRATPELLFSRSFRRLLPRLIGLG